MRLTSNSFDDGQPIPGEFALGVPDADTHVTFGANRNPHLAWSGVPDGTRSLALLLIDRDAPSVGDDVNQEDREVPVDLERVEFSHWVLVDLPPDRREIEVAEFSEGVTAHGKPGLTGRPREGINDYTGWFTGNPDMAGIYKGYDGAGPPWNDSIAHHYTITLYALDVETLDVDGDFTAADVESAMEGHILDQASLSFTYAINLRLRA